MTEPEGPESPSMPAPGPGDADQSVFMEAAGLHLERVGRDEVTGWIDLGPEHHQPRGLVHGGVYATAIESASTVGAAEAAREHGLIAVGLNNNTNFLRSMTEGRVRVSARPLQQGRTQQLWEAQITDRENRLVAVGQVRLQNIAART